MRKGRTNKFGWVQAAATEASEQACNSNDSGAATFLNPVNLIFSDGGPIR